MLRTGASKPDFSSKPVPFVTTSVRLPAAAHLTQAVDLLNGTLDQCKFSLKGCFVILEGAVFKRGADFGMKNNILAQGKFEGT